MKKLVLRIVSIAAAFLLGVQMCIRDRYYTA